MPATRELIVRALEMCHGWNTSGSRGLLPIFDEINRYMVSHDCERNILIDSATGLPPYLTTVAGTFAYDLPATYRKLKSIFIDTDEDNYDSYGLFEVYKFKEKEFFYIPVTSRPKTLSTNATVTFRDDPGATTAKYFLEGYRACTSIGSIDVELDTEEEFHDLVLDGVLARVRSIEFGDQQQWMAWRERVSFEYWAEMNKQMTRTTLIRYRHS